MEERKMTPRQKPDPMRLEKKETPSKSNFGSFSPEKKQLALRTWVKQHKDHQLNPEDIEALSNLRKKYSHLL